MFYCSTESTGRPVKKQFDGASAGSSEGAAARNHLEFAGTGIPTDYARENCSFTVFPETVINELCQLCLFKSRAEWPDGLSAEGRNSGYLVAVLMGTWRKIGGGSEMSEGTSLFWNGRSDRVLKNRR
jgi:hypothetical protein